MQGIQHWHLKRKTSHLAKSNVSLEHVEKPASRKYADPYTKLIVMVCLTLDGTKLDNPCFFSFLSIHGVIQAQAWGSKNMLLKARRSIKNIRGEISFLKKNRSSGNWIPHHPSSHSPTSGHHMNFQTFLTSNKKYLAECRSNLVGVSNSNRV